MRVLLDTNILISYLLRTSGSSTTVSDLIEASLAGKITIIVPVELVRELELKVATKRYLRARILDSDVDRLVAILRAAGESLPAQTGSMPSIVRDPKDNYLLAAAAAGDVDVLISGDSDLLDIRHLLRRPAIMRAAEFLTLLGQLDAD